MNTRSRLIRPIQRAVLLLAALLPLAAPAQTKQRITVPTDVNRWIASHFAKGKLPPFSFVYDGEPSAAFLNRWTYSKQALPETEPGTVRSLIAYTDKRTGLRAECEITGFPEFQAVEWVLRFTNTSDRNSGIIEQVRVTDYTMDFGTPGDFTLYKGEGSNGGRNDFMLSENRLETGRSVYMAPEGGRSSDRTGFPFFNIAAPGKDKGVIGAIGWTGNWYADIAPADSRSVTLRSGMERMRLRLYPQESIRTPRVCLLFWKGDDFMAGQNRFRRFMLAHHARKIDGKFAEYPLSGGFDWGDPAPCNEYTCLTEEFAVALVKRYKQFGIEPEVYWLDAGWYVGCGGPDPNTNWTTPLGSWKVDPERFPRGLKPIADQIHRQGSKFMVWFEPERVRKGSLLEQEHPEWLLRRRNDTPDSDDTFLLDLGNPEALGWLCTHIGDMLEENGIDYYRQDFNIHASPYWYANEEQERIGIREIRHVEGLYAFWDYLLERFPRLLIDNCAAGGRRFDLETFSRSAPLWRTDYQYGEPNGYQCHTYALNFFLPLHGTGVYATDDYNFRSSLSSAMVMNWELTGLKGSVPDMQKRIQDFKRLRPYFYEDYYPLTGVCDLTGDDVWLAYQMHRPSDQSGMVMAFRRKDNASERLSVKLRGLDPEQNYTLLNDNSGESFTKTGAELARGIVLEIDEAPGSLMLLYAASR